MKDRKFFRLLYIPDLTLSKYRMGNVNGIDGIIDMHNIFLRQWNRKCLFSDISLHLIYVYNPLKKWGERIDGIFFIEGKKHGLENVWTLLNSSLLIKQFKIEEIKEEDFIERYVNCTRYNKCCTLSKKELFIKPPKYENDEQSDYYNIAKIESNEEGRLYQMFTLMASFDEPVAFRIDLYSYDMSQSIRGYFDNMINYIQRKIDDKRQSAVNRRSSYLDSIIKDYEKLFENIENNPHFVANIVAFGKYDTPSSNDNLELILDAAASESIKKGNYNIATFISQHDSYSTLSLLNDDNKMISYDENTIAECKLNGCWIYNKKVSDYSVRFLPVLWTIEEVSPFFRLPLLYENEEIQIKKETSIGNEINEERAITIGRDLYNRELKIRLDDFVKHIFISGVPGSGKTNAMLKILSEVNKKENGRIPFLVFEPAKKEYRALLNTDEGNNILLVSPHLNTLFPIEINPFEFPKGIVLSQHIAALMKVFSSSFNLEKNVYEIIDSAIEQAYIKCGWKLDDINDELHNVYPTLNDVYELAESEIGKLNYSSELHGNVSSYIRVRLGGLLKRDSGEVFNTSVSSWKPEEWINKSVIVELEALSEQDKNFFVLLVCTLIYETLMVKGTISTLDKFKLRHIIVIEEAHNIIAPQSYQTGESIDSKISATAYIVKMLAEVRALGEGMIIADQLPSAMAPEVIKNTTTKFVLKMLSNDDREIIGRSMLASDLQIEKLITYDNGKCLYFGDKMQKPIEIQFEEWVKPKENKLDDNAIFNKYNDGEKYNIWKLKVNKYFNSLLSKSAELKRTLDILERIKDRLPKYKELAGLGAIDFLSECKECSVDFVDNMKKIEKILKMLSKEEESLNEIKKTFFVDEQAYAIFLDLERYYYVYEEFMNIMEV